MDDVIKPSQPPTLITAPETADHLTVVKALARVMDTAFHIPGTNVRVGLDSIIGLIPGIGDAIGSLIGSYIVLVAARLGVSRAVLLRMMLNLGIDTVIGIIPIVGDALDVAWKANVMNAKLLERALAEPRATSRASAWMLVGLALGLVAIIAGGIVLGVWLVGLAREH